MPITLQPGVQQTSTLLDVPPNSERALGTSTPNSAAAHVDVPAQGRRVSVQPTPSPHPYAGARDEHLDYGGGVSSAEPTGVVVRGEMAGNGNMLQEEPQPKITLWKILTCRCGG